MQIVECPLLLRIYLDLGQGKSLNHEPGWTAQLHLKYRKKGSPHIDSACPSMKVILPGDQTHLYYRIVGGTD